ncbi:MAG: response regulator [Treponema sp.]|jgi:signal transduction histidine kinase/CheY-like chemotaxis protein/HPt (histidine-containing phosphotransfer) domain-containing protein|nr:response regulator [Treponema sp.]
MKRNRELSRLCFISFYSLAMVLIVLFAWNEQNKVRKGGSTPIYRNLMEHNAYVRRGFDPADIQKIPAENSNDWVYFESSPPRIKDSALPNLPVRRFLSPWGSDPEEFTIIIPVVMDVDAITFMNSSYSFIPGIYLACVGENWEIFFNGKLILSEMHLDESGRIMKNRTWRDVYFPVDRSLFVQGINILALRIVGDPTYKATGLAFKAPNYLDNYRIIERRQHNFLLVTLFGIFAFTGVYFLMLFLFIRKKSDIYYLYFSIFSFFLCIYTVTKNGIVNSVIPNSNIQIHLENISLFLSVCAFCFFMEIIWRRKITKITWGYLVFCLLLIISQFFFSAQYKEDTTRVWNITVILYYSYVFFDIVYLYFWGMYKEKRIKDSRFPLANILIGAIAVYFCGLFDIVDILFFDNSFSLFVYGTFVVHIGMTFALSQRFKRIYNQLEQSNVILESAVHERTLELEKQTAIAVEASHAKSIVLAKVSHEIRNPLNSIIGFSEIELRGNLPDSTRENINHIYHSGSTLLRIVNDLLDISKIEAGSFELSPVEYETAPFISDTVSIYNTLCDDKPIKFVLEIGGDFPDWLIGDELRVRQILNNLLSNAFKFSNEGAITLSISYKQLTDNPDNVLVCFIVKDTGMGIREEDIGKIFDIYTQLDAAASQKAAGTGLGLEITKKLIEKMDGSITVKSEYGQGSVFTVELIQGLKNTNDKGFKKMGQETAESLQNFKFSTVKKEDDTKYSWMPNARVLIVDDIPLNFMVVGKLLEPYGVQVETASSGQEAVDMLKAGKKYDIVFMDHMMPELDGMQTTALIREWEREKNAQKDPMDAPDRITISAMTANVITGMHEMFLENDFDDFLAKPVDISKLDEILEKWIPDEKKEYREADDDQSSLDTEFPSIPGVNLQIGIERTGGTLEHYISILQIFIVDAEEKLLKWQNLPDTGNLPSFLIDIHTLKNSIACIGANELSARAKEVELAARSGDLTIIEEKFDGVKTDIMKLIENIKKALAVYKH